MTKDEIDVILDEHTEYEMLSISAKNIRLALRYIQSRKAFNSLIDTYKYLQGTYGGSMEQSIISYYNNQH